ncbi:LLM class flavin-dependent oxidoreductase [Tersicoccus sp. Bi-70]|uniref:LLM class flavin-dependent oxidoreductase n=1 Tax=Tersicoccus sp. Bi-70 TaxID=1897634 RepID=UPI000976BD15|nr:LLM class flavin-dependent oxidoreductase [Tersicoccus sp. Bi-70]OMH34435.1 hypothetical protein BGP79_04880 [Tersicoccus sp. Bi-70]
MTTPLHLAVGLDGAGWHPAAWREAPTRAADVFTGRPWLEAVRRLEDADVDAVSFEDGLGLQPPTGHLADPAESGRLTGRLDASLIAAWLAGQTTRIGLIPTITTTHTEPFHTATNIASLDHASQGRAGWRVQISARAHEADHVGRRDLSALDDPNQREAAVADLLGEAGDAIEVARLLWDSWETDAEIRDAATGRFIDRDRLHRAAFAGSRFSVLGPSITPRPPQGQPVVMVLAHTPVVQELAARGADVVLVTPQTDADIPLLIEQVRVAEQRVGRIGRPLQIWADAAVGLASSDAAAATRLDDLDARAGEPFAGDAALLTGSAATVAERLNAWHAAGLDGVRLRPLTTAVDVPAIADHLVPLIRRTARQSEVTGASATLQERLGLGSAANRFAATPPFSTTSPSTTSPSSTTPTGAPA